MKLDKIVNLNLNQRFGHCSMKTLIEKLKSDSGQILTRKGRSNGLAFIMRNHYRSKSKGCKNRNIKLR